MLDFNRGGGGSAGLVIQGQRSLTQLKDKTISYIYHVFQIIFGRNISSEDTAH